MKRLSHVHICIYVNCWYQIIVPSKPTLYHAFLEQLNAQFTALMILVKPLLYTLVVWKELTINNFNFKYKYINFLFLLISCNQMSSFVIKSIYSVSSPQFLIIVKNIPNLTLKSAFGFK